jgi:hypothetical protein
MTGHGRGVFFLSVLFFFFFLPDMKTLELENAGFRTKDRFFFNGCFPGKTLVYF